VLVLDPLPSLCVGWRRFAGRIERSQPATHSGITHPVEHEHENEHEHD
jgi:hypothetical protein